MRVFLRVTLLVSLLSAGISSFGQTSTITGTVHDSQGAVISGADIRIIEQEQGTTRTLVTNGAGIYSAPFLNPGPYRVYVQAQNFSTAVSDVLKLEVGQTLVFDVSLTVGSTQQQITVDETAVTLNVTDASIGNAVDNATVAALPLEGRNVQDLLSLQPGVLYLGHNINQDQDSRSGSVSGSRSDQGNITLDGLDNNDQVRGYAFTGVLRSTVDSVDQFRVTTSNAGVESGRASGAQVNVVTKSGTDSIHGTFYEYNRNTLTAANNWFNKEAEASEGLPNVAGKLIRNTYGATIGGPVKRGKIFYFASYEGQRTAENAQVTQIVPTESFRDGELKYPYQSGSGQADFTLTPQDFAAMDPHCSALGTCPWGPGADPNILNLVNTYPLPNGSVAGDGLNSDSYTWSAPNPTTLETYILKFDLPLSDRHRFFVRGNLQNDKTLSTPMYPGQAATNTYTDNTKGIAAGDVWTLRSNLVNNFRYGFTRQGYANRGAGSGAYITLASFSNPIPETRSTIERVPSHNFVDDITWIKARHNFQFGVNYRLIHAITDTDAYSYNTASSSGGEYYSAIANTGQDLDPSGFPLLGFPSVAASFDNSYSYAAMNLAGVTAVVNLNYVYKVNQDKTGTLLPQGALVNRNYKANQFEYYLQDTFQVTPKLSINYGIRHSLEQTPYEVNGQQVQQDLGINSWFNTRVSQAALGNSVQPYFNYVLSGKANHGRPMWQMAKLDLAPRVGVAYAVDPKTSVRAGFGMSYDNFGLSIAQAVSTEGSAGLLGSNSTPAGWTSVAGAPRFTSISNLPTNLPVLAQPAAAITFPYTPPIGAEGFEFTVDDGLKTPYSYELDFSVQRQVPGNFTVELDYVGRLGHRLLQNRDIGMPLDLVDRKGGGDYFKAIDALENMAYQNIPTSAIKPLAYWEDLFPDAANAGASGSGTPGQTATQNIYDHYKTNLLNGTYDLYDMDVNCNPGCGGQRNRYFPSQYSDLFTQSSIGTSSYHSAQLIVRHPMKQGFQADFSYTLGKSIDLGSDSERIGGPFNFSSTVPFNSFSQIVNAFNPRLNRAVSDFDTKHLVTADWVYELPFGRSRRFLDQDNKVVDGFIGGWQLTGLARWTSGLPFGSQVAGGWVTAWSYQSFLVKTGPVKTHTHIVPGQGPQAFADPNGLEANILSGNPLRYPVPGEAGTRNAFRGDGYFGIDTGLHKQWSIYRHSTLAFAWEVFNVTNSVRFDTNPNTSLQSQFNAGNFGFYSATLTQPRIQQFSMRLTF